MAVRGKKRFVHNHMKKNSKATPRAMGLASRVREPRVEGKYESASQTWSDRSYACSALKKHCEDR